jgi:type IV pilus assembly protein PilX
MKRNILFRLNPTRGERGAVLIVVLMFLVVLTMLGLSAMTTTTLEEKMSGNARDYNVALQAAEATLRDAQTDITATGATGRVMTAVAFTSACPAGLCLPTGLTNQMYSSADWGGGSIATAQYGAYTGTAAISSVATQPRYMIELLPMKAKLSGLSTNVDAFYLRITARAWGINPATQVTLQTVYITPLQAGF